MKIKKEQIKHLLLKVLNENDNVIQMRPRQNTPRNLPTQSDIAEFHLAVERGYDAMHSIATMSDMSKENPALLHDFSLEALHMLTDLLNDIADIMLDDETQNI